MARAVSTASANSITTPRKRSGWLHSRLILLIAFTFSVMADPVSSVSYAIEAALHALHNNLALLLPTMTMVVLVVALVVASYHQLVARFPEGGGSAAAAGSAFGEGFAFIPMGALIVDFVLTIAISVSAGASAIISYVPRLAPLRLELALTLVLLVAGLMWFGHFGRAIFAALTIAFIVVAAVVLVIGVQIPGPSGPPVATTHGAPLAVLFAFPVAMALATGIEAPSSAIAQLDELDSDGRRSFGQWALWLTLGIVGTLTLALTAAIVSGGIGLPPHDSTLVAELARATGSPGVFAAFQAATALLLLSAASSSFQAGPGLLKALSRHNRPGEPNHGVLPAVLGRTNKHHVPVMGVLVFLAASALVVAAAGGYDQRLVLFYAVAVFVSFMAGLAAMARFAHRERRPGWLVLNIVGMVAVGFTLLMNLLRPAALVSLGATVLVGGALYVAWVRAGRPRGTAHAVAEAEGGPVDSIASEDAGDSRPIDASVKAADATGMDATNPDL
ncbi:amino acid permease [Demequina aurantiaca]|uniref:amino acid permease n=1 Tax=Demequina aurantiaca TaxID=676200 RepID=UPI003D346119